MNPFTSSMPISLTGGAGGAAGPAAGTSNNGLAIPISNPFNFDSSGWNVNFGTMAGNTSAPGAANGTNQTATPSASSAASGASGSTGTSGGYGVSGYGTAGINASMPGTSMMIPLLLGAVGLFLVLGHKL